MPGSPSCQFESSLWADMSGEPARAGAERNIGRKRRQRRSAIYSSGPIALRSERGPEGLTTFSPRDRLAAIVPAGGSHACCNSICHGFDDPHWNCRRCQRRNRHEAMRRPVASSQSERDHERADVAAVLKAMPSAAGQYGRSHQHAGRRRLCASRSSAFNASAGVSEDGKPVQC
jgi:hypothetical protein